MGVTTGDVSVTYALSFVYPSYILRISFVYPSYIFRVSIVYLSCLVREYSRSQAVYRRKAQVIALKRGLLQGGVYKNKGRRNPTFGDCNSVRLLITFCWGCSQ